MCGIIGITCKHNSSSVLVYEGLTHLQHRGQDSAGICTENQVIKDHGLVKDIFHEEDISTLTSSVSLGHVRYSTNASFNKDNIQPIWKNDIFLVHNGNIVNEDEIKKITNTENCSDSSYILDLFNQKLMEYKEINYENIFQTVGYMMQILKGSYCVIILIKDFGMICFRDIFGIRPMIYGKKGKDYVVCSESSVIELLDYQIVRDVKPGEVIVFEKDKMPRFHLYKDCKLFPCLFEFIYFARIDSIIDNISIYDARFKMGFLLGEKIKKNIYDIDSIVYVPDSSLIFALGVQESLKKPIQNGFVKNNYIDRTFIMKNDQIINKNIKRKINGVKTVLQNKNILIVDDSIVRGNTCSHIVFLAKKAGANKIYFGSGAPQILYKNRYGIYIPDKEALIAYNRSNSNIADIIGVERVVYNDLYEIVNVLKQMNKNIDGFETSMFNNIHLIDY